MEGPSQGDLVSFKILLSGMYAEKLELPTEMAQAVGARRKLELCLDDDQGLARWKVELFLDGGHSYLHRGWKHFARALDLRDGYSILLRYDGYSQFNVKVFDLTSCRKQYTHNSMAGGRSLSLPIPEPKSFAVILKKFHLKSKCLNVPMDFDRAHDYGKRDMVMLRMAGQTWVVGLQRTFTNKVYRTSFRFGWRDFCIDNDLNVGDTCFFSVIRECTWSIDDDMEWEEEEEVVESMLKVEVRKTNGRWRR